jgi:hypothetical protein
VDDEDAASSEVCSKWGLAAAAHFLVTDVARLLRGFGNCLIIAGVVVVLFLSIARHGSASESCMQEPTVTGVLKRLGSCDVGDGRHGIHLLDDAVLSVHSFHVTRHHHHSDAVVECTVCNTIFRPRNMARAATGPGAGVGAGAGAGPPLSTRL